MRESTYQKVYDDRKRRVRSLWKRNGWFYARLAVVDEINGHKSAKRVRLESCRTVAEARIALQELQKDRRERAVFDPIVIHPDRMCGFRLRSTHWPDHFA